MGLDTVCSHPLSQDPRSSAQLSFPVSSGLTATLLYWQLAQT